MKQLKLPFVLVFIFMIASPTLAATPSTASNKPDFTKGQAIPPGATHDWNLGPTGARGWMYSNEMETSEARQILITSIDKGSPASTVLEKNDVILGVTGTPFSFDPRTEFGRAVTVAESSRGLLNLIRWRAGHVEDVTIQLSVLGSYSETAPFECRKSANIFANGCDYIAKQMQKKPDRGNPIERCLNALALLASGNKTYWPLIRYQAAWASHFSDPERRTLHSWYYGSNQYAAGRIYGCYWGHSVRARYQSYHNGNCKRPKSHRIMGTPLYTSKWTACWLRHDECARTTTYSVTCPCS